MLGIVNIRKVVLSPGGSRGVPDNIMIVQFIITSLFIQSLQID